jgi:mannose-1-phosphate guanylyltransferase
VIPTLVLTAGLGTRLDPLTRLVAKPAVPVAGRALIEHVLDWLRREGLRQVVLNLHHRPHTLTEVVGDGAHLGLAVRYSWEDPVLGSAGGPRHALGMLAGSPILLVNGDTLCDLTLAPLIAAHAANGADVTLALVPNTAPDRYNGVVVGDDGRVTGFVPRGRAAGTWHFTGVQVAQAEVFASLPDGVPAETVSGIYRERLAAGTITVHAYRTEAPFLDVGTPRDYLAAALRLAATTGARTTEPGADVDPSAELSRTVVWPGVRIGPHVRLHDCVAAGRVAVPAGFEARGTILVPDDVATDADRVTRVGGLAVFPLDPASAGGAGRRSRPTSSGRASTR